MAIYRYQHGDRPLEGYTIQHGLGRGGFGEVYYAISDSGREVALKAVQNYGEVELRGIKHCMNLKNPHLVSIFDIRHNDHELPFVIMEYVDGPSLRDILDSHPGGLGPEKAAFFLKEIVNGLSYLHECGVVHRDLKPHNVFYEQGVVKIGDYSLSKAISTSHRTGHTVTVGTVHYMAPEISMGRYDHTVDIYALGVLLYEMLKGHPPFVGDTMGEVLMKHMAGEVDLSGIDEPFAQVIRKSLQKEPQDRYQSAEEMVAELLGNEALETSVAALAPETLTVIAERAMKKDQPASPGPPPPPHPEPQPTAAYYQNGDTDQQAKDKTYPYTVDVRHTAVAKLLRSQRHHPAAWFLAGIAAFMLFVSIGSQANGPLMIAILFAAGAIAVFKVRKQDQPYKGTMRKAGAKFADAPAAAGHRGDGPYTAQPVHKGKVREPKYVAEPVDPLLARVDDESSFSRLVALVMSGLFFLVGIAGLQRFYVGRVKSGLLWLLTFGLLGIGQLYDTIMIAVGQFRDAEGRRVLDFTKDPVRSLAQPVNQYSAVVRKKWTDSRVGFNLGNLFFNMVGAVFLIIALGLGAVVAVDIPRAIADGAFSHQLRHEFARESGMHDWNVLVSFGLGVATVIMGTLAAICLIFARRESSWGHMFRIPVAAAAFVGSVVCLGTSTGFGRRWSYVSESVGEGMVGEALTKLLRGDFWPGLICACVLFVVAVFILAWPAKQRIVEETYEVPRRAAPEQAAQEQQIV